MDRAREPVQLRDHEHGTPARIKVFECRRQGWSDERLATDPGVGVQGQQGKFTAFTLGPDGCFLGCETGSADALFLGAAPRIADHAAFFADLLHFLHWTDYSKGSFAITPVDCKGVSRSRWSGSAMSHTAAASPLCLDEPGSNPNDVCNRRQDAEADDERHEQDGHP